MYDYLTHAEMNSHLERKRQSHSGVWRYIQVDEKRRFFRMPGHMLSFASDPVHKKSKVQSVECI